MEQHPVVSWGYRHKWEDNIIRRTTRRHRLGHRTMDVGVHLILQAAAVLQSYTVSGLRQLASLFGVLSQLIDPRRHPLRLTMWLDSGDSLPPTLPEPLFLPLLPPRLLFYLLSHTGLHLKYALPHAFPMCNAVACGHGGLITCSVRKLLVADQSVSLRVVQMDICCNEGMTSSFLYWRCFGYGVIFWMFGSAKTSSSQKEPEVTSFLVSCEKWSCPL